jgi:hypothetical protein
MACAPLLVICPVQMREIHDPAEEHQCQDESNRTPALTKGGDNADVLPETFQVLLFSFGVPHGAKA